MALCMQRDLRQFMFILISGHGAKGNPFIRRQSLADVSPAPVPCPAAIQLLERVRRSGVRGGVNCLCGNEILEDERERTSCMAFSALVAPRLGPGNSSSRCSLNCHLDVV